MDTRDRLLALIDLVYAAPGDAAAWRIFLRGLCAALDGSTAQFVSHDVRNQSADVSLAIYLEAEAVKEYNEYWGRHDPWVHSEKASGLLFPGAVVPGEQLITKSKLKRTDYYNEYGLKFDVTQALGSVIEADRSHLSFLAISGGASRASFSDSDVRLLQLLAPHLRRAVQLHRRLTRAEAFFDDAVSGLGATSQGIIVLDARGRPTWVSPFAQAVLSAADALVVENGEIRTTKAPTTTRLHELVAAALATSLGTGLSAGGTLLVGRTTARKPLRVTVSPATRHALAMAQQGGALILVEDPERRGVVDEPTIRALLGLTLAEARLVKALADGLTLEDAASRLNLTVGTARTRLKTVFEKTGVHRQRDLLRLILAV